MAKRPPIAFTAAALRALKPMAKPYKRADAACQGEGALLIKIMPSGAKVFYFRYRSNGIDKMKQLGAYDETGRKGGLTLAQARTRYHELSKLHASVGDVKEHVAREQAAKRRHEEMEKRKGSFGQLLHAYVQSLRVAGKASADQVAAIFARHIERSRLRHLLEQKAHEITPEDIQALLSLMVKRGIQRQVNQLRSYLHAAFAFGGKQDHDPRRMATEGVRFYLKGNPVAIVPRIAAYDKARDRHLSEAEFRAMWTALDELPAVTASCIRFVLALGGQRVTQLLRARWPDYNLPARQLLLRDSKGRGGVRDQLLPMTDLALCEIEAMRKVSGASALPFTNDGRTCLRLETVSSAVKRVSDKLVAQGVCEPFRLSDLRRTCETMMASIGIDKETRAQILSHGRAQGVQNKHYDRYTYLAEKKAGLEKWERKIRSTLNPDTTDTVIPVDFTARQRS